MPPGDARVVPGGGGGQGLLGATTTFRRGALPALRQGVETFLLIVQNSYPNRRCQGDEAEDQDSDASCLDHNHASHSCLPSRPHIIMTDLYTVKRESDDDDKKMR